MTTEQARKELLTEKENLKMILVGAKAPYREKWVEALQMGADALELKRELIEEIPTFEHIVSTFCEIFEKYDIDNHTEIEKLAFNEYNNVVQDLQWLLERLKGSEE